MRINFPSFDAHLSPWWRFCRGLGFSKEHCVRGVCRAGVLWGPRACGWVYLCLPRCPPSVTQHPSMPAAPHLFALHCLPPTVLPAAHHPYERRRSSSALLGSPVCSWPLFSPFILLPWLLPPTPRWLPTTIVVPGTNRVSTPLDCELLQRDLGHRRVGSQYYSLPDAWPATNMCCCCFFLNK